MVYLGEGLLSPANPGSEPVAGSPPSKPRKCRSTIPETHLKITTGCSTGYGCAAATCRRLLLETALDIMRPAAASSDLRTFPPALPSADLFGSSSSADTARASESLSAQSWSTSLYFEAS